LFFRHRFDVCLEYDTINLHKQPRTTETFLEISTIGIDI
jgi:hypothetical protein